MTETKDGKAYSLGAGIFGPARLDLQYFQILQTLDNQLVDPCIPYKAPNLKIADVCCGTGIDADATSELHALDLNLANLPAENWVPNLKRHTYNIHERPPGDLLGFFDIINVSLSWTFIPDSTVDKVFANVLSMLKPGGYVQWLESCAPDAQVLSPDPAYTPKYLSQIYSGAYDLLGMQATMWPSQLDEVFKRNGLTVLNVRRTIVDPPRYKSWTTQQMTTWQEVLETAKKKNRWTEKGRKMVEEWEGLLRGAHEEVDVKGCVHIIPFMRVVGRKDG